MTKSEVVDAFIRGDLDRRGFIKKLTAVGVSSTAAMAYAATLVQDVAASPSGNGTGFITRGFMQDEDYGLAVLIENVVEALGAILDTVEGIAAALNELFANFDVADFLENGLDEGDFDVLQDVLNQINEQIAALGALLGGLVGVRRSPSAFGSTRLLSAQMSGSLMDQLGSVADDLNQVAGMYAALLPSIEGAEDRDLLTQVAIVSGRHAALVSYIAGLDPVPSAFEQPVDPTAG